MSETGYLLAAFLLIIFIVSVIVVLRNQYVKQKLKILGAKWDFETSKNVKDSSTDLPSIKNDVSTSSVYMGTSNQYKGDVENIAGQDIILNQGGNPKTDSVLDRQSEVNMGDDIEYHKKVKNVSGRDIRANKK